MSNFAKFQKYVKFQTFFEFLFIIQKFKRIFKANFSAKRKRKLKTEHCKQRFRKNFAALAEEETVSKKFLSNADTNDADFPDEDRPKTAYCCFLYLIYFKIRHFQLLKQLF